MDAQTATVEEFCQAHRICRKTFYNMLKDGTGPRIMKVGSRTYVSNEAAAEWRKQREENSEAAYAELSAKRKADSDRRIAA